MSMQGTLLISTLDCKQLGKSRNIERCVCQMTAKKGADSFANQSTYIIEKGCGVWIPFGFLGMIYGLPSHRASLQSGAEVQGVKKGQRRRKKADEVEYCSSMWVPAMSVDRDKEADPAVVTWVHAHLLQAQAGLKEKWMAESGYKDWMEALYAVSSDSKMPGDVS